MRLLRTSVAAVPAPPRTRNFRLTAEQAERLRGNSFERFLRRLAMPGLTMLRPVAGVAVAMGLTIAVVGTSLPMAMAPAAAPTQRDSFQEGTNNSQGAGATPAPAAAEDPTTDAGKETDESLDIVSAPGSTGSDRAVGSAGVSAPETTGSPSIAYQGPPDQLPGPAVGADDAASDTTRVALIYGGVTLAMLSFAILLLAWFARRRLEDPLLR